MIYVTVDNNVRCAVQDLNPRGRQTVLFVHGWPLSTDIFEPQYDVLPSYGIRCVGLDLRGYGDSDRPFEGYSYDRLAEDLHRCICELDLRNITLVGFSMGGAVCARYMARYRNARVCRLALCGAACPSFVQRPGYPYGMTNTEVDTLIAQAYYDRPRMAAEFASRCFASNPSPQYLAWFQNICGDAAGWSTIFCAQSLRDEDLRADLPRIRVPTAILHGVHDQVCPYVFAQQMQESIPGSWIIPFEHSGHCLFYDEKDKFNSTIVDIVNTPILR